MFNVPQAMVDLLPDNVKDKIQKSANYTFMASLYFIYNGYHFKYGPERAQQFAEQLVNVAKYDVPENRALVDRVLFTSRIAAQASIFAAGAAYRNIGGTWTPLLFTSLAWVAITPNLINRNQVKERVIESYTQALTWSAKAKDAINTLRLPKRQDDPNADSISARLTSVVQYFVPGFTM